AVKAIRQTRDPEDSRLCCELYKRLPSRRELKDYFLLIKNPIDLQMISSRLKKQEYRTLGDFERDVRLLFSNARTYNVEGSLVYEDANTMERVFDPFIRDLYLLEEQGVVEGAG
ncbi:unnamed protein product, partial [Discosporangium mesarthrocarpum]